MPHRTPPPRFEPIVSADAGQGAGSLKGRGTAWAIPHRYGRAAHEAFDDGWGTLDQQAAEERLAPQTQII
jgi:hypothetical protein